MKKYILAFLFLCCATIGFAQCISIEYTYDLAGNRISRTKIDLTTSCSRKGTADTATEQISENKRMVLFPNPVQELLNIHLLGDWKNEQSSLWLYDLAGKQILMKQNLNSQNEIPFASLPIGMYIVKVFIDNKYYEYKVVKN